MTDIVAKCDRCGEYKKRIGSIWLGMKTSVSQSEVYKFCPECAQSLADWFSEKRQEKTAL